MGKQRLWMSVIGLVVAMPGLAVAQAVGFGTVDADGNGMLSQAELVAAFGDAGAARVLANQDLNGDGMLSPSEARPSGNATASGAKSTTPRPPHMSSDDNSGGGGGGGSSGY